MTWDSFYATSGNRWVRVASEATHEGVSLDFEIFKDDDLLIQEITGYLKWDGCCNWNTYSSHICDWQEMSDIAEAFQIVYALGANKLKNVDYDVPNIVLRCEKKL